MQGDPWIRSTSCTSNRSASGAGDPAQRVGQGRSTSKVSPLSINHQSQFPAVTLSFNLAEGYALGDAVTAINKVRATSGIPPR